MTSFQMAQPNPYVGPRAFQTGETLYGRERETLELLDLLIAERIVLFYAPSGAGKSSLIQAALIPELEKEGFEVLPVMRVGREPALGDPVSRSANRYVLSLLLSLEESLPAEQRTSLADLSGMKLLEYLAGFTGWHSGGGAEPEAQVLIVDQFEEILTVDPANRAAKEEFFAQVGAVLRDRRRWALFTLREDYLAGLDPYVRPLPTRLNTTYRLDLLGPKVALEAIRQPAEKAGRPFAAGVAETLVDNLRRTQPGHAAAGTPSTEQPSQSPQLGAYVEPVHLQIVCRQLWDNLPADRTAILAQDVQEFGDVDEALTRFYETALQRVLDKTDLGERRLRNWIGEHLVTPARTRGLVFRDTKETEGLPNAAIDTLNDAYVVRADIRGNDRWYELAHDRLVEPILASNLRWQLGYQNPLTGPTQAWLDADCSPEKLIDGSRLKEARAFAQAHPADLTEDEQVFLSTSARQALQAARRRRNTILATAGVILVLSILTLWALWSAAEARRQARLATARELSAQAITHLTIDPERSILLSLHALDTIPIQEAENALRRSLISSRIERRYTLQDNAFWDVAYGLGGDRVFAAAQDGTIAIWNARAPTAQEPELVLTGHISDVLAIALDAGQTRLASGGVDGTARIWDLASGEALFVFAEHEGPVWDVAFSPDGACLATAGQDGTVRMWDTVSGEALYPPLSAHAEGGVLGLAFDPQGIRLATAGEDDTVLLWDLSGREPQPQHVLSGHTDDVYAVAFSPDGTRLASVSRDKAAIVWEVGGDADPSQKLSLFDHTDSIYNVAFSPNGRCLASASLDRTARLWDAGSGQLLLTLYGHHDEVRGVSFVPGQVVSGEIPTERCGTQLATAGFDGALLIWNIGASGEWRTLTGHTDPVEAVVFSPDGTRLATASSDGTAKVWDPSTGQVLLDLADHRDRVNRVAFSPDGARLATASYDGTAKLWDAATGEALRTLEGHTDKVQGVDWSPDGHMLATAGSDGNIILWDAGSGQATPLPPFYEEKVALYDVAFSLDGTYLVGASEANEALVISIDPLELEAILEHDGAIYDLAFSPDGRHLATAGWDNLAKLWSAEYPWARQHALAQHVDRVFGLGFNADGKLLATASADKTAIVWDVRSGEALQTLPGADEELTSAAFHPDGTHLAVGSDDGTVRFYLLDRSALVEVAKSRLTRSWTDRECQLFLRETICPPEP